MATTEVTPQIETREVPTTLAGVADEVRQEGSEFHRQQREDAEAAEQREESEQAEAVDSDIDPEQEAKEGTLKLPNRLSGYDQAKVAKLMQRFGLDEGDLENRKFQEMLKKALDSDAYVDRLKAGKGTEAAENEEAENEEAETDEKEGERTEQEENAEQPTEDQTPQIPQNEEQAYVQHVQELQREAFDERLNSPFMVNQFQQVIEHCLGADTPESKAMAGQLTRSLVVAAHSMLTTYAPYMIKAHLAQALEEHVPGLQQMHLEASAYNIWEGLRAAGNADLPKFDTPEFREAADRVYKENKFLSTMTFKDENGRTLPRTHPAAMRQEAMLVAKILNGERVTPKTIADALAKGAANAVKSNRRVSAGRALGSGRSTGGFSEHSELEGGGLMSAYNSRHGGV